MTLGRHEEETFWEDVMHLMASAVEALKQRILIRRTVGPHSKPGAPHDETEELAFSNVEVKMIGTPNSQMGDLVYTHNTVSSLSV